MSTIFAIVVNTPKLTKTTQREEIFIVGGIEQRAGLPTTTPGPQARAFIERYFTGENRVTRFLSSENP
jgi:hypothetical protein